MSLSMQVFRQDPAIAPHLRQNTGTGAVSEENTSAAVIPIHERRNFLGSNNKSVLEHAALNELLGRRYTVKVSRTGRADIKSRRVTRMNSFLNQTGH